MCDYRAYGSSNGEDSHCDLGDVLTVPQVNSLEEVHVRHSISNTSLLEPATVDRPLSEILFTDVDVFNPLHVTGEINRFKNKHLSYGLFCCLLIGLFILM
jgi:hypothetical protein